MANRPPLQRSPLDAAIVTQRGAAIVEFALLATLFLSLLLAVMDFGRLLFTWNAASEATRWGARVAVVCGRNESYVRDKMRQLVPQLRDENIEITWFDPLGVPNATCDKSSCMAVRVSIYSNPANPADPLNVRVLAFSPFLEGVLPPVPAFPAYLPRESMEDTDDAGDANPICL